MMTILTKTDRDRLVNRVHTLTPEHVPVTGTLTAHCMLCHIADQLAAALGEIPGNPRASFFSRTVGKWFVLYAPVQIPFGKVKTVPEMLTTRPSDWNFNLARFEMLLVRLAQVSHVAPHSVFGPLSHKQWGILAAKHIDHHLRQFGV